MLEIALIANAFNTDIKQDHEMSDRKTPPTTLSTAAAALGEGQSEGSCLCKLCDVAGCDVRIQPCGCALHAVSD